MTSNGVVYRCLRSDRKLLQILFVVTFLFCFNILRIWNSHTESFLSPFPDLSSTNDDAAYRHRQNPRLDKATNQYFDETNGDDDYESIFCRNRVSGNKRNQSVRTKSSERPVFLWGIPSTMSDYEVGRRKLLRSTYLNFYKQFENILGNSTIKNDVYRTCSLQEWTCQYDSFRDKCQLIYVFFIGSNPDAPPEVLDQSLTDFRDLLFQGHQVPKPVEENATATGGALDQQEVYVPIDKREPGVVFLNIRENQFDGKMTTWFKFAELVGREYPEIDYAAKVDSDLLLFTPNFFEYMGNQHMGSSTAARVASRTYGGVEFPDTNCVMNYTFDHSCPLPLVGPSYMSGELNFMSMDLARYITSDECPRQSLTIPHEDVSLSNYVYSYTNNTQYHMKHHVVMDDPFTKIHIISVNTSRILITSTTTADWNSVNLRNNPELFSKFLWGHSIKRGNHKRFLVFKKDKTFQLLWERFIRAHAGIMKGDMDTASITRDEGQGKKPISKNSIQKIKNKYERMKALRVARTGA